MQYCAATTLKQSLTIEQYIRAFIYPEYTTIPAVKQSHSVLFPGIKEFQHAYTVLDKPRLASTSTRTHFVLKEEAPNVIVVNPLKPDSSWREKKLKRVEHFFPIYNMSSKNHAD